MRFNIDADLAKSLSLNVISGDIIIEIDNKKTNTSPGLWKRINSYF